MYDQQTVDLAISLKEQGMNYSQISRQLGISRYAIREWCTSALRIKRVPCPAENPELLNQSAYAYLLGLYLGDGCISIDKKKVAKLRVACANSYPGLIKFCEIAMLAVHAKSVGQVQAIGCVEVYSN